MIHLLYRNLILARHAEGTLEAVDDLKLRRIDLGQAVSIHRTNIEGKQRILRPVQLCLAQFSGIGSLQIPQEILGQRMVCLELVDFLPLCHSLHPQQHLPCIAQDDLSVYIISTQDGDLGFTKVVKKLMMILSIDQTFAGR